MVRVRAAIHLLLLLFVVVGCVSGPLSDQARAGLASSHAGLPGWSVPQQIPNLLCQIVEAVQKAVEELEDSLREQLCSRCPVSMGGLLLAIVWALGHDWTRRS